MSAEDPRPREPGAKRERETETDVQVVVVRMVDRVITRRGIIRRVAGVRGLAGNRLSDDDEYCTF